MLTIQLPNIAVQKVTNGYVVQWQKKNTDKTQSQQTMTVTAVCIDKESLLVAIDTAADDISSIG